MTLTSGKGPLTAAPAGRFVPAIPQPVVYVEPFRRRVRGVAGGEVVVDCEAVVLVHRPGGPPEYAFPAEAVSCASRAVPELEGYVAVAWDDADEWWEEEQRVFLHPRNPYHRVDCVPTRRRLRVEVAGVVVVDTCETVGVYETSLEPLLYVSPSRLRDCELVASPKTTYCPYKGTATYWDAHAGGRVVAEAAWSYEDPLPEAEAVRGLVCFDGARVGVEAEIPRPAVPPVRQS